MKALITTHFSLLSLAGYLAFSSTASAVTYRVDELKPVAGFAISYARSINDRGEVVGDSSRLTDEYFNSVATVWRGLVPTSLGYAPKGYYSHGTTINNLGKIAGDANSNNPRPIAAVFRNASAILTDGGANNSHAIFYSDKGFIVGSFVKGFGGGAWLAAIWSEDAKKPGTFKTTLLPAYQDPAGGVVTHDVIDANNSGQVIANIDAASLLNNGSVLWKNDAKRTLVFLPRLDGFWSNRCQGINDKGEIVGVSEEGVFRSTPIVWEADAARTITRLPLLPGDSFGQASKINNLRQIIGSHGNDLYQQSPAVWINGQINDLQSNLNGSGIGWTLDHVEDINNLGQIVGTGHLNGNLSGFVLTPVAQ
jgi:uncharacterized membrane protein